MLPEVFPQFRSFLQETPSLHLKFQPKICNLMGLPLLLHPLHSWQSQPQFLNFFHTLTTPLKPFPALRAKLKILSSLVPTLRTMFIHKATAASRNPCQMFRLNFNLLPTGNRFPDLRDKFIQRVAATRLHIIMLIPLEARYEIH